MYPSVGWLSIGFLQLIEKQQGDAAINEEKMWCESWNNTEKHQLHPHDALFFKVYCTCVIDWLLLIESHFVVATIAT